MRLIDAEHLTNDIALYMAENAYLNDTPLDLLKKVAQWIIDTPTIDPERLRPQGEWVKSEDDYCGLNIIKCSLCREEWCFEVDDDVETLNYHYCPYCGAKMKGAENNA